jgi:hypothetical protein
MIKRNLILRFFQQGLEEEGKDLSRPESPNPILEMKTQGEGRIKETLKGLLPNGEFEKT